MTTPADERRAGHPPSETPSADGIGQVDLELSLPDFWTTIDPSESERETAQAELTELLAGKVDDPDGVAEQSMNDFFERLGVGGNAPQLIASFRLELDDDSVLSASLIVAKNELGGSLDPWSDAYPDHEDVVVDGSEALRTSERSTVQIEQLYDEPLTVCTWRFIVPFDRRSVLTFAFSTPNHELDDLLLDHFDEIMGRSVSCRPATAAPWTTRRPTD